MRPPKGWDDQMTSWLEVLVAIVGGLVLMWLALVTALWVMQRKSADEMTLKKPCGCRTSSACSGAWPLIAPSPATFGWDCLP
jgi:hypothetical protein